MGNSTIVRFVAAALGVASPGVAGAAVIQVEVGPGITAGGRLPNGEFECADHARCVFDTPAPARFEIRASGPAGHPLRWTGCVRQSAPDRCTVEISGNSTVVTVK